ncbi:MAG: hypothetical protein ACKVP4_07075 [Hyphomicrobium sp.]
MLHATAFRFVPTLCALLGFAGAAAAQGYTTRIEPRPFYGAVITLEEGVRVIRPLPPERQVIINPDHGTPLSLGFNETRVYENRVVRHYHEGDRDDGYARGGGVAYGYIGKGYGRHGRGSGYGKIMRVPGYAAEPGRGSVSGR